MVNKCALAKQVRACSKFPKPGFAGMVAYVIPAIEPNQKLAAHGGNGPRLVKMLLRMGVSMVH